MQSSSQHLPGVEVTGTASAAAPPDRARLRLSVAHTESSPSEAFASSRSSLAALREVLARHGVAGSEITSSRLGLHEEWRGHDASRTLLGYRCHATLGAVLRQLDALEGLLGEAVESPAVRIEGVDFEVTEASELYAEAQRAAVDAARTKAERYADAAEVALGPVVHLQDLEAEPPRPRGFRAAAAGPADGDLAPGLVTVEARVRVGFALRG